MKDFGKFFDNALVVATAILQSLLVLGAFVLIVAKVSQTL